MSESEIGLNGSAIGHFDVWNRIEQLLDPVRSSDANDLFPLRRDGLARSCPLKFLESSETSISLNDDQNGIRGFGETFANNNQRFLGPESAFSKRSCKFIQRPVFYEIGQLPLRWLGSDGVSAEPRVTGMRNKSSIFAVSIGGMLGMIAP